MKCFDDQRWSEPQSLANGNTYRSVQQVLLFNCAERTFQRREAKYYADENLNREEVFPWQIGVSAAPSRENYYAEVRPGSAEEIVMRFLCVKSAKYAGSYDRRVEEPERVQAQHAEEVKRTGHGMNLPA